jgi:hypothetical protein
MNNFNSRLFFKRCYFFMVFNLLLTLYMLWLIMVVSYIPVGGCVIEFFNSLLACFHKQEGCLVLVTKRFVTNRRIFIGWNPVRRNMQKNVDFFAVGKFMLCVGGGLGAAGTSGGRGGPLTRGGLCDGKPMKGENYILHQAKWSLIRGRLCA